METRPDVLERVARTNPLPQGARVDRAIRDRLYGTIVAQPRLPIRRRTPGRRVVAAAVVVLALAAVAAPALAFSDGVRSFLGLQSDPAVLEESQLLVSAPVAEGTVARLWASPSKSGGECSFVTLGPPGNVEKPSEMGGGICHDARRSPERSPSVSDSPHVSVTVSKRPLRPAAAAEWVPPVVQGYVDPILGATRVEIRWTGGSKELTYANGHFIGAVGPLYQAPAELLPIRVLAFDAEGREVHRREIDPAWFRIE